MDIRCGNCSKLFRVADEKIAGKGIRFKCSKCGEVVTITKQDFEMDLLAREGEAPAAPLQAPPAAPSPQPTPLQESREYQPQEYKPAAAPAAEDEPHAQAQADLPRAGLEDFDFSAPDVAAQHAQQQDAGLGGFDLGEQKGPDQDGGGELSISEEEANEAESAFSFPVDLISEPKRKPAFAAASAPAAAPPQPETTDEPAQGEPSFEAPAPSPEVSLDVPDLGETAAAATEPEPDVPVPAEPVQSAAVPEEPAGAKGPVISPELLAQMKRASATRTVKQETAPPAGGGDIDLGAALAIPKGTEAGPAGEEETEAAVPAGTGQAKRSGKSALVLAGVMVVLGAALAVLYALGYFVGKNGKPAGEAVRQVREEIAPDGLAVENAHAYVDQQSRDLVMTGVITNSGDRPKDGWYLELEVYDAGRRVIGRVAMVNGVQILSRADFAVLQKRGMDVKELKARMALAVQSGTVPAKGNVTFEAHLLEPAQGAASFLPFLKKFEPVATLERMAAGMDDK